MQSTEPETKIYEPRPSDYERITVLSQRDAPVRIYEPVQHPVQN